MEAGSEATIAPEGRRDGRRTFGYVVCVVLWALTLPPLAAAQIEEGGGIDVTAAWVGAVIFSLGIAALIRFGYTRIRKRPVMSPWLFLLAAVIAVFSLAGQSGS